MASYLRLLKTDESTSIIWNTLFNHQYPVRTTTTSTRLSPTSLQSPRSTSLVVRGEHNKPMHAAKVPLNIAFDVMQNLATVEQLLSTFVTNGPAIARMALSGLLSEPSFTVTLQRDALDIGGNIGVLSIGELPGKVKNDSLVVSLGEKLIVPFLILLPSGSLYVSIQQAKEGFQLLLQHPMRHAVYFSPLFGLQLTHVVDLSHVSL